MVKSPGNIILLSVLERLFSEYYYFCLYNAATYSYAFFLIYRGKGRTYKTAQNDRRYMIIIWMHQKENIIPTELHGRFVNSWNKLRVLLIIQK